MTFENFATLTTVYITKFTGCRLLDRRTGKMISKDLYRLGAADKHKLAEELRMYGFDLKDIEKFETKKANIDIRDYFNCGEEI